jgi:endonuclease/exonuclease/phosphatase family metal-dependent hydrolase
LISRIVLLKRRLGRKLSRTRWVARLLNRDVSAPHSDEPGLIILQIDGLSRKQLDAAMAAGRMPFLRRLMQRGHFNELSFYSGLPSTTPAVQAEVMFGVRTAVPAFQFLDRKSGRTCLMYEVECAKAVGGALAAEHQPLLEGGRSYSNIYAAGAEEARLCAETMDLKTLRQMATPWKIFVAMGLYFFTILRVAFLAVIEFGLAVADMLVGLAGSQHWRAELHSIPSRVGVSIIMREWLRIVVKLAIEEGAPIVYANFLGYDEQAHRRGPGSSYAHWVLKGIDDVIHDIFKSARKSDVRDYEVVVFSDHGQEHTRIYDTERGSTIQEAATRAFTAGPLADHPIKGLDNYSRRGPETDERARRLLRLKRGQTPPTQATEEELAKDVIVTALGPLGHIYSPIKLTDDDKQQYARALVRQEQVPLVIYCDEQGEVHAINQRGAWKVSTDAALVFGPEHPFLEEAATDLMRLCAHPNSGDLIVSGWSVEQRPLTFVHENGAHGSIGSEETRGFALLPHALHVRQRRPGEGKNFIRGEDLYRAVWQFVHPARHLPAPRPAESQSDEVHAHCRSAADSLRVMTYNVHSCIGIDGKVRPERIVSVIRSCKADVIALQEVDANRPRSRHHEQARVIAEALGMSHHYYAISDHGGEQYGLAVISRYPLGFIRSGHLTPANAGRRSEARGALWVRIDSPTGPIHLINTHFGLRREERLKQMDKLLGDEWLANIPAAEPVIVCGDLNAGPKSPECQSLLRRLNDAQALAPNYRPQPTFISTMPVRRLDHIFVSSHFSVLGGMQPRTPTATIASDHLPVCIELSLAAQYAVNRA